MRFCAAEEIYGVGFEGKLKGGSLVPGSEVGWRWVWEVERATGYGRMEARGRRHRLYVQGMNPVGKESH